MNISNLIKFQELINNLEICKDPCYLCNANLEQKLNCIKMSILPYSRQYCPFKTANYIDMKLPASCHSYARSRQ